MAEHLIEIEKAETDLLACATYVAENIKSASGHAEAINELLPRYLEKGAVDLAAELANAVDDPFVRDRLLLRVAEKCAAVGDDDYAFQLVEAIEESVTQDEARQRIAGEIAGRGDFSQSFAVAETLAHPYFAFVEISGHLAAANEAVKAREIIEKIDFPNAKVSAFLNLAALDLERENVAEAVGSLDRATEAADEIEFDEEKINALADIGNHYLEAEENGKAVAVFDKARTAAERLDTVQKDSFLGNIALGFLHAGSLELADRTLDLVNDNVQISSTLVGYAREFWRRGEKTESLEALEEAYSILKSQKSGDVRSTQERVKLWAIIAADFARSEKPERALEIAQEIPEQNAHNGALTDIAQICAARGETESARQAVNQLEDDSQKMFALLAVSDAQNDAGNAVEALETLRESATLAETVDRLAARSYAFDELARRFHHFGDEEKMREMFYENLDTIEDLRDESDRVAALARMSEFYEAKKLELNAPERQMLLKIIAKTNG